MPTLKQKKVVNKVLENIGKNQTTTAGQILRESGYSPAIVKNPQMVLKSKGVIELFEKAGITKDKLAVKYNELLDLPLKENQISADTLRKTLDDLSKRIIDVSDTEANRRLKTIRKIISFEVEKTEQPEDGE